MCQGSVTKEVMEMKTKKWVKVKQAKGRKMPTCAKAPCCGGRGYSESRRGWCRSS